MRRRKPLKPSPSQLRDRIGRQTISEFAKSVVGYSERSVYGFFAGDPKCQTVRLHRAVCEALGVKP